MGNTLQDKRRERVHLAEKISVQIKELERLLKEKERLDIEVALLDELIRAESEPSKPNKPTSIKRLPEEGGKARRAYDYLLSRGSPARIRELAEGLRLADSDNVRASLTTSLVRHLFPKGSGVFIRVSEGLYGLKGRDEPPTL